MVIDGNILIVGIVAIICILVSLPFVKIAPEFTITFTIYTIIVFVIYTIYRVLFEL